MIKQTINALAFAGLLFSLTGCPREADVASQNLSNAADEFQINRRIVFYNGITDTYMLEIVGLCSLGNHDDAGTVTVTCKTGPGTYKKHFLYLSDNVTLFSEQIDPAAVGTYRYTVNFKPSVVIPDFELNK